MEAKFVIEDWDALRARIDSRLAALAATPVPANSTGVQRALAECMRAPGKRIRAMLVEVAADDLIGGHDHAIAAGCAVELVHTASLLLDDLPCMDDAQMRRGRPAIHITYGEDVAILTSIALLGEAFGLLSQLNGVTGEQRSAMTAALAEAIGVSGLVGGQYADLHHATRYGNGHADDANDRKTGALFVAALRMAGHLAGADAAQQAILQRAGLELGRAFQLYDDLLDIAGDPARMGKDAGKDGGKAIWAQLMSFDDVVARIDERVALARDAFAALPSGGRRLRALLHHLFDTLAATQFSGERTAVLPSLMV